MLLQKWRNVSHLHLPSEQHLCACGGGRNEPALGPRRSPVRNPPSGGSAAAAAAAAAALRQRRLFAQEREAALSAAACDSPHPPERGGCGTLCGARTSTSPGSPPEPSVWTHHAQDTGQRHRDSDRRVDPGDVLLPVAGQQAAVVVVAVAVGVADPRQGGGPWAKGGLRSAGDPPGRQDQPADSECEGGGGGGSPSCRRVCAAC